MTPPPVDKPTPGPHWLLRRTDQLGVAILVLAGLGGSIGWWFAQGGWHGRLVEFERPAPCQAQFQVDLNTASWPELAQLPGLGETLARRIVASRHEGGPFLDHDDLLRVRGIGPRKLESVRPYLLPMPTDESIAER